MRIRQKYKAFIENHKKKALFQALTSHGLSKFETWCHFWQVNSVVDATNNALTFINEETFKEFLVQIAVLQVDKKKYPYIDQDFYKNIHFLINRNEPPKEKVYIVEKGQLNLKTKELERKYQYGLPPILLKTLWAKIKHFFFRIIPYIKSIFCDSVIKNPGKINGLCVDHMNSLMNHAPKTIARVELNEKVNAALNNMKSSVEGFLQKMVYFFIQSKVKKQIERSFISENFYKIKEFNSRDFEKYYSFKKDPIPFGFNNDSKNTVQAENLELVVDQDEQQHLDQEAAVNVQVSVNLLTEVNVDMALAVDLTKRIDISKVTTDKRTYERNPFASMMLKLVSRGYRFFDDASVSFVSENAQKALMRARKNDFNIKKKEGDSEILGVLPMGFFIEEKMVIFKGETKKERVLCYSEDYRQEQKYKKEPTIDILTEFEPTTKTSTSYYLNHRESKWGAGNGIDNDVKEKIDSLIDQSCQKVFNNWSWADADWDCGLGCDAAIQCSHVLQKVFLTMKEQKDKQKDPFPIDPFFKLISDFLDRKDIDDIVKQNFIILIFRTSLSSYCVNMDGVGFRGFKVLDFDKTRLFKDSDYLKSLKKVFLYQPDKIKTSMNILKNHNKIGSQASIVELQNIVDRHHKILLSLGTNMPLGVPEYLWEFPDYLALISGARSCDLEYLSDVPSDQKSAMFLKALGYRFVHKEMMANKEAPDEKWYGGVVKSTLSSPDVKDSFLYYFWYFESYFHAPLESESIMVDFFSEVDFYAILLNLQECRYRTKFLIHFIRYNENMELSCVKALYLRGLALHSALSLKEAFDFWDKSVQEGSVFHPFKNHEKFLEEMKKEMARVACLRKEKRAEFEFDDVDATLLDRLEAESLEKSFSLYNIEKLNTFLISIGLSEESENSALADSFAKINTKIEGLKEKTAVELSEMLKAAFKAEPKPDVESVLALLALVSFRISSNKGEPVQLRLEQMVAIFLSMSKNPTLFQIDTGEGKTLILNMVSLLYVSQGKKVKVVTHNEYEAKKGIDQMQALCALTGVSVGKNKDIQYIEATKAIQAYLKDNQEAGVAPKDNEGPIVLVDEVDQVLRHLPALSSTHLSMRKQDKTKTKDYYDFLQDLLRLVKEWGDQKSALNLVDFIHDRVFFDKDDEFWANNLSDEQLLKKNIENAKIVLRDYKKNKDYVIEGKAVRLVQKSVSGRRADKKAQLANGLQAFLIAKELLEGEDLELHGETDIIATGSIFDVMRYAEKTMGYTGTAGSDLVKEQIKSALATGKQEKPKTFVFPRAERKWAHKWPSVPVSVEKSNDIKPVFSKRYDFPPQFLASKKEQWTLLLERIKKIREDDGSVIVFFETISEVLEFDRFLEANHILNNQLYHDAIDMRESELIVGASTKKTVTIATSAAGRGIDFKLAKNLAKDQKATALYAIVTHPALESVLNQALARVGRNEDLGFTEQIYVSEDFSKEFKQHDYTAPLATKAAITPCKWHQEFSDQQELSYTQRLCDKQEAKPYWRKSAALRPE